MNDTDIRVTEAMVDAALYTFATAPESSTRTRMRRTLIAALAHHPDLLSRPSPSQQEPPVIVTPPTPAAFRRFLLRRFEDPSGVSGTGVVAEGVQFSDLAVAVRWLGAHPSTAAWGSIADVEVIHGHGGLTAVAWILPGGEN